MGEVGEVKNDLPCQKGPRTSGSPNYEVSPSIKKICQPLRLTKDECVKLMRILNEEIDIGNGIAKPDGMKGLRTYNTFVTEISLHKEPGTFLTLDFKGKYYRVILTKISSELESTEADETLYIIPKRMRLLSKEEASPWFMRFLNCQIFSYIADTLRDFLQERGMETEYLKMAFVFNFPTEMHGINEGVVVSFTKEFECPSLIGQEVVGGLQDAIRKLGLRVEICALLNDTVGALAAGASRDPDCYLGMILSSGVNCAYFEKLTNIQYPVNLGKVVDRVALNTEWGALGEDGCLDDYLTEYDREVDRQSFCPGKQIFEKLTATLYMGEVCRLILVKAIAHCNLLDGIVPDKLTHPNSVTAQYIFDIDRDPPDCFHSAEGILRERFRISSLRKSDLIAVRYICRTIITRCANLLGSACAAIIQRVGKNRTTVAVDGAFFRFSQQFPFALVETIGQLIPLSYAFTLRMIDDAAGRGAAAVVTTDLVLSKQGENQLFVYGVKL
ncbi:Phosphotransferase [Fasciola gigantica]|uniref:Phosphotransferase n=1 Tax=Fasciola gigantica TaxID=46835 RepID=A0A504YXY3_FASGI|nr:Phosphotransferase [Fasciola gigantica]